MDSRKELVVEQPKKKTRSEKTPADKPYKGNRKKLAANKRKEEFKKVSSAVLRNCPTSPRKMRYVVDMIRGKEVTYALDILHFSQKEAAGRVEKLLKAAIATWQQKNKNEEGNIEETTLYVKEVYVDGGKALRRLRTAPQGRGYRVLKRSNHVTLVVDKMETETKEEKK